MLKLAMCIGGMIGILAAGARADVLLTSSAEPGAPLEMFPGTTSDSLLVSAVRDGPTPPVEDYLSGWQLSLRIVPEAGAAGTLSFELPERPATGYVFEGLTTFGFDPMISTTGTVDDSLSAFDISTEGGVPVPADPGAGLMVLELIASNDADGLFGIYAVGDETLWTDSVVPDAVDRQFNNIAATGLTRIAEVSAVIPEPSSLCCLVLVAGMAVFMVGRGAAAL